jgi:hypothetical protein
MSRSRITRQHRRLVVGLLLCALLATQSLGQWHRVLHGHGHAAVLKSEAGQHAIGKLFASHHGDADCRAFDQAGLADMVFGAPPTLVEAAPAEPALAPLRVVHLPPQAAAYRARAPPTIA